MLQSALPSDPFGRTKDAHDAQRAVVALEKAGAASDAAPHQEHLEIRKHQNLQILNGRDVRADIV